MKVLVIPDIHCRKFWRKTIEENLEKVDKVIFLGDYLDPYEDEIKTHPETMEVEDYYDSYNAIKMLEDIITLKKTYLDKIILLTGNHTDSYIWSKFTAAYFIQENSFKISPLSDNINIFLACPLLSPAHFPFLDSEFFFFDSSE